MPAGMSWAKMMITPKVLKNQTPKSPIPLTPPAKAIIKETIAIAERRTKLKMTIILFMFPDIFFSSKIFNLLFNGCRLISGKYNFLFRGRLFSGLLSL